MLDNGNIIDSALLPGGAVEGHAVEVSEDSLLQSVTQTPPFGQQSRNQGTAGLSLLALPMAGILTSN